MSILRETRWRGPICSLADNPTPALVLHIFKGGESLCGNAQDAEADDPTCIMDPKAKYCRWCRDKNKMAEGQKRAKPRKMLPYGLDSGTWAEKSYQNPAEKARACRQPKKATRRMAKKEIEKDTREENE
jgi:hypothetical protein